MEIIKIVDVVKTRDAFGLPLVEFKLEKEGKFFEGAEFLQENGGENFSLINNAESNIYAYQLDEAAEFFNEKINHSAEGINFFIDEKGEMLLLPVQLIDVYNKIEEIINN